MKHCKRALALLLCVGLLLSLAVPALADRNSSVKQYSDYCCIGDSVAAGYGMTNLNYCRVYEEGGGWWWGGDAPRAHFGVYDQAFPGIIRDAVGARYHSLTCVGMNLTDALWMLGGYEEFDVEAEKDYHYYKSGSQERWDSIEYMHDTGDAIECVRQSSLINIFIGSNDLFTYAKRMATANGELEIDTFIEYFIKGYGTFITLYPRLIERVLEINPTCDIVLCGLYNPYAGISITDDSDGLIGSVVSQYMQYVNLHIKSWAAYYGCGFADTFAVSDSFEYMNIRAEDFMQRFGSMDNHPDVEGHAYIASQILAQLPKAEKKLLTPQAGLVRLELDGKDAGSFTLRKSGLGWTLRDMQGNYVCYDSASGHIILRSTDPTVWKFNGGLYVTTTAKGKLLPAYHYLNVRGGVLYTVTSKTDADLYVSN